MSLAAAQKRKKILIAAIAAVTATGAFIAAITLTKGGPGAVVAAPAGTVTARYVVATAALVPGHKITANDVHAATYATNAVTPDSVTDVKQAVGKYVKIRVGAGSVLVASELALVDTSIVAGNLKPGDVAISIPFDETKGVGGYVQAEDHLDIICDPGDGNITTCFRDVRVLKSGGVSQLPTPAAIVGVPGAAPSTPAADAATGPVSGALVLVIELSHQDAEKLSGLLSGKKGSIVRYALLNPADAASAPSR